MIYVWGRGGHGAVVMEALRAGAILPIRSLEFCDDDTAPPLPLADGTHVALGVGDNVARKRIAELVAGDEKILILPLPPIIHPRAYVALDAVVCPGAFVAAGAVVGARARVGMGAIINTGATVDHDCEVWDFAHVAPGAHLCGRVRVGRGALVGAGSVVVNCTTKHQHDGACGVRIREWSLVRAGTVVQGDVPDRAKVGPGVWSRLAAEAARL